MHGRIKRLRKKLTREGSAHEHKRLRVLLNEELRLAGLPEEYDEQPKPTPAPITESRPRAPTKTKIEAKRPESPKAEGKPSKVVRSSGGRKRTAKAPKASPTAKDETKDK